MTDREKALYAVFSEVRTCFNLLKSLAEKLHADTGVTPAMRAVLETLARNGPQTVPDIARAKGVSRQHIQMIVNSLIEAALADTGTNPAHRKSQLVSLTRHGTATFTEMTRREETPLATLAAEFDPDVLSKTRTALTKINQRLHDEVKKGKPDARD